MEFKDFEITIESYDKRKYPPDIYWKLYTNASTKKDLSDDEIRQAILWNYGKIGTSGYPLRYDAIIEGYQTWFEGIRAHPLEHVGINNYTVRNPKTQGISAA
ncbi:hypothetical protein FJZ31_24130 [Candidatus Poribacteria bacterium]|nr:hypothetical protein [Candidatus Poribacteria bacterium]